MLLSVAIQGFVLESKATLKAESTIYRIDRFGQAMLDFFGDVDVETITAAGVNTYVVAQRARGLADHSVWGYHKHAKALLNWCHRNEILRDDIGRRLRAPRLPEVSKAILSDEQVVRLCRILREDHTPLGRRNWTMIGTLLRTGLRSHEISDMDLADWHADPPYLMVRRGKWKKPRPVPVAPGLRRLLWRYVNDWRADLFPSDMPDRSTWLFPNNDGLHLTNQGVQKMCRACLKRIGVVGGSHIFRHTFATIWVRTGGDVERLRHMLGHASLSVTQGYLHLLPADMFGVTRDPLLGVGL